MFSPDLAGASHLFAMEASRADTPLRLAVLDAYGKSYTSDIETGDIW